MPAEVEQGAELLKRPWIAAEIERQRDLVRKHTVYEVRDAMAELDSAIEFARAANSAMPLTGCLELRAKLHGLLVEKCKSPITRSAMRAADQRLIINGKAERVEDAQIVSTAPCSGPATLAGMLD